MRWSTANNRKKKKIHALNHQIKIYRLPYRGELKHHTNYFLIKADSMKRIPSRYAVIGGWDVSNHITVTCYPM